MTINIQSLVDILRTRYDLVDSAGSTIMSDSDFVFSTNYSVVETQRIYELQFKYLEHNNVLEYQNLSLFDSAESISGGIIAFNADSDRFYVTHKNTWKPLLLSDSDTIEYNTEFAGENYGFVAGGTTPALTSSIERFPFSIAFATATEVSELSNNINRAAGLSSVSHGYTAGGYINPPASIIGSVEKFNFVNTTPSQIVGDLATGAETINQAGHSSISNGRGVVSGGGLGTITNLSRSWEFSSDTIFTPAGGAFGDSLIGPRRDHVGLQSAENYFYAGGYNNASPPKPYAIGNISEIRKSPWATAVPNVSFGNLTAVNQRAAAQSSPTEGYVTGGFDGGVSVDTVQKFPFATGSGATNIGTLSTAKRQAAGQTSTTAGYTAGGFTPVNNQIEQFPFASSPGSAAIDIGNLSIARYQHVGTQY